MTESTRSTLVAIANILSVVGSVVTVVAAIWLACLLLKMRR